MLNHAFETNQSKAKYRSANDSKVRHAPSDNELYFAEVFERFVRREKHRNNKSGIFDEDVSVEAQSLTKEDFPLCLMLDREGIKTYL